MRALVLDSWGPNDPTASTATRRVVLEVHIRRFYRISDFGEISFHETNGFLFATTSYDSDDGEVQLVVGYLPLDELPTWSEAVEPHLAGLAAERDVIVDVVVVA